jgi:hypothetical protein
MEGLEGGKTEGAKRWRKKWCERQSALSDERAERRKRCWWGRRVKGGKTKGAIDRQHGVMSEQGTRSAVTMGC